jgi:hypothetical protein
MARVHLCFIVSSLFPVEAMLSVFYGVGGCGYPISSHVVLKTVAYFALRNTDPISACAPDDITCLRIVLMIKWHHW